MDGDKIALQLYTLREHTAENMIATLSKVADIGYRNVELAGYGGVPLADLREAFDECGLKATSAHVPLGDWEIRPEGVLEDLRSLGCHYAVVPSVPEERRRDRKAVARLSEIFNHLGTLCRQEGVAFAYHNHAFEFAPLDGASPGVTMWDVLTEEMNPEFVRLELDLYWACYAGVDPVGLLERHAGRAPLLHLKDMADNEERADAPVGEGVMPWGEILRTGENAGAQWYIVEQDHPRQALDEVWRSLRNLHRILGEGLR